jgi:hypothetical protein
MDGQQTEEEMRAPKLVYPSLVGGHELKVAAQAPTRASEISRPAPKPDPSSVFFRFLPLPLPLTFFVFFGDSKAFSDFFKGNFCLTNSFSRIRSKIN